MFAAMGILVFQYNSNLGNHSDKSPYRAAFVRLLLSLLNTKTYGSLHPVAFGVLVIMRHGSIFLQYAPCAS